MFLHKHKHSVQVTCLTCEVGQETLIQISFLFYYRVLHNFFFCFTCPFRQGNYQLIIRDHLPKGNFGNTVLSHTPDTSYYPTIRRVRWRNKRALHRPAVYFVNAHASGVCETTVLPKFHFAHKNKSNISCFENIIKWKVYFVDFCLLNLGINFFKSLFHTCPNLSVPCPGQSSKCLCSTLHYITRFLIAIEWKSTLILNLFPSCILMSLGAICCVNLHCIHHSSDDRASCFSC